MYQFAYRYEFKRIDEEDQLLSVPQLPEIASIIPSSRQKAMSPADENAYATEIVLTALQARIKGKKAVPPGDILSKTADNHVVPSVLVAMKLAFYEMAREKYRSVYDLAKKLGTQETAVRRLLNLRHPSTPAQMEKAADAFGIKFVSSFVALKSGPS